MKHTLVACLILLIGPLLVRAEASKERLFIDQGINDKRLAGYLTPEEVKLEIVLEHPVLTNPVALVSATTALPMCWSALQRGM